MGSGSRLGQSGRRDDTNLEQVNRVSVTMGTSDSWVRDGLDEWFRRDRSEKRN